MTGAFVPNVLETWRFLPAVASLAAPTVAEVAAGTNLDSALMQVEGFTAKASNAPVKTWAGGFSPKVQGAQEAEDSAFIIKEEDTYAANAVSAALAYNVAGFIMRSRYTKTPIATTKVDVFPIRVGGNNRLNTADDTPAQVRIDIAITAAPAINGAVAA